MKIGFIGIGQMGQHMSKRILDAGYELIVHDLKKESASFLLEKGAKWADTPKNIAESSELMISSLPAPKDIEQMVYGENGLKFGWKPGDIYMDMSTNSPSTIKRIARDAATSGVAVLDAPVSGGTRGAELGTLAIMVGGESATLKKVRKVLETMGKNIFYVGGVGNGNVIKLINNMIALACGAITAEGFVLGVKAGIDPQILYDIVKVSTGSNWAMQQYPQTVFKGNFTPMYRLSLASKDIGLALGLGKEYNVPLTLGAVVEQKLIEATAAGFSDQGVDAVIRHLEELTGAQVRSP
jgi:2-hydroxymethylglutarate dehydrogenase